jgi:hypothetical protein
MSHKHHHAQKPHAPAKPSCKRRLMRAATATTGVHSILDLFVLADIMHKVHAGATGVLLMVAAWYAGRTILAFLGSYIEEA